MGNVEMIFDVDDDEGSGSVSGTLSVFGSGGECFDDGVSENVKMSDVIFVSCLLSFCYSFAPLGPLRPRIDPSSDYRLCLSDPYHDSSNSTRRMTLTSIFASNLLVILTSLFPDSSSSCVPFLFPPLPNPSPAPNFHEVELVHSYPEKDSSSHYFPFSPTFPSHSLLFPIPPAFHFAPKKYLLDPFLP